MKFSEEGKDLLENLIEVNLKKVVPQYLMPDIELVLIFSRSSSISNTKDK